MNRSLRLLVGLCMVVAGVAFVSWLVLNRSQPVTTRSRAVPIGKRSILLVTVDTTRPDRLEPYGAQNVETPVLQRLAEDGLVFERAFAVAPLTLPSHTSILSGLYPPSHGVRNNGIHYVPDDIPTLATILGKEGYRTAAFVSAAVLQKQFGLDRGFDLYDDDLSTSTMRHPRVVPDRPAEATVASARAWLDGLADDELYFAWVHFYDPHAAYNPPPPYRDQYRSRLYDGEIAYLDAQLGVLFEHPRIAAAGDDAPIVVVIGDHGESLGEHGENTHGILAYDSSMWVPWIMRVPGGPRGARTAVPVSQVDVAPTLLELTGVPAPPNADGDSIVGLIENPALEPERGRVLYGECYLPFYTYGWARLRTVRYGRHKLIGGPKPELYNTLKDPRELTNLYEQSSNDAYDMTSAMEMLRDRFGDFDKETRLSIDDETADQLRALGYMAVGSGTGSDTGRERPSPMAAIAFHVGLERARQHSINRLYDKAVEQVNWVLERDPANLAAWIDLSEFQMGLRDFDGAVAAVDRAIELDPEYGRLYLIKTKILMQQARYDEALEHIDLALGVDPRHLEARVQKARTLYMLERYAEADGLMAAVLAEEGEHAAVNLAYAELVDLRDGDLDAAEPKIRKALERDPFIAYGWSLLGKTLELNGRQDEAIEAYRTGLTREPDFGELHADLGLLLARSDGGREAEIHLKEAIRLLPEFRSELHVSLGALLAEAGRYDEAQQQYALVLESDPGNPGALNNRAIALFRSGEIDEAEAGFNALLERFPRHGDAYNNLAAIALTRRQWNDAERYARQAVQYKPRLAEGWNNLGWALDEQGEYEEAESCYRKAIERNTEYWPAQMNLGITLRKMGRSEEAVEILEEVLQGRPSSPEAHLELAGLFDGPLDDPNRARLHYNAVLKANPRHPQARAIRDRLAALPPY